jgi:hypothetical protein
MSGPFGSVRFGHQRSERIFIVCWSLFGFVAWSLARFVQVVFAWKDFFWLVVDPLREEGLLVYRSKNAADWTAQPGFLLAGKGRRRDDNAAASHADVRTSFTIYPLKVTE